ncbi:MAG: response regulator, partial [Pseudomonadota bacterium]
DRYLHFLKQNSANTFVYVLKLILKTGALHRRQAAGIKGGGMFAKNALVVDDSSTARTILKHQLGHFDVTVESAHDGSHALKLLRNHKPDVIFLDHVMPGLDGFEVLQRLKADSSTRRIPVVMYTSQAAPKYIREAMILGAVAVIPKNVSDEQLARALNKAEVYQIHAANDGDVEHNNAAKNGYGDSPEASSQPTEPAPYPHHTGRLSNTAQPTAHNNVSHLHKTAPSDSAAYHPIQDQPRRRHSTSNWLVMLLLAVLAVSHVHMFWRDQEQQQLIGDLRHAIDSENARFAAVERQLSLQQNQINETSYRQMELVMNLLMDRVGDPASEEPSSVENAEPDS